MRRAVTTALSLHKSKNQRLVFKSFSTYSLSNSASSSTNLQVRSVSDEARSVGAFEEMASGTHRRYYMLGGKGGVGKTSCAASLAVRFANHGHPTMVVSTDPAHSLSDSFAQDLSGGNLVPVQGVDSPLFALEIDPEKSRDELSAATEGESGNEVRDLLRSLGLGMLADRVNGFLFGPLLGDLKLGDLLDKAPPGLDEVMAIYKVMEFVESQKYSMFTRIVFDTAPTGHTLRLLSLPDFMDASVGKMMRLKKKLASAASALKSLYGKQESPQDSSETDKLEQIKEKMSKVRNLFRNPDMTEFIIVTIPTVMAVCESSRLRESLTREKVPVHRLVVNQVIPQSASGCKFCSMKHKDQSRAIEMIRNDPELSHLSLITAPLVDAEIRGVPALKFMGDLVWR